MFQAKWSTQVQQEVIRNVEAKYPRISGRLNRTFELMELAVPDCRVVASSHTLALVVQSETDSKDLEILAAAIDGGCTHLVTANLKDFDIAYSLARGVAVIHPDEFLEGLIVEAPASARIGMNAVVGRYKNPPRSRGDFCDALRRNLLVKTASRLESL